MLQPLRALWDFLFPPKCVLCRRVLSSSARELCQDCEALEHWHPSSKRKIQFLDSHTAIWYYEENPRRAILSYKFYRARHLGRKLGRLLAAHIQQRELEQVDCITWVPVTYRRRWERGYNQSELLAKEASRVLGIPALPLLKKVRHTRRQARMNAPQRKANILGAFAPVKGQNVAGKRVLLIDDVLTTGATAGECARVLSAAGAREVHCAAVAASRKL